MVDIEHAKLGRNKVFIIKEYKDEERFNIELDNCNFYNYVNEQRQEWGNPYISFHNVTTVDHANKRLEFFDAGKFSLTELNIDYKINKKLLEDILTQTARYIIEGQNGIETGTLKPRLSILSFLKNSEVEEYELYLEICQGMIDPILNYDRKFVGLKQGDTDIIEQRCLLLYTEYLTLVKQYLNKYKEGLVYHLDSGPDNIRTNNDRNSIVIADLDSNFQTFEIHPFMNIIHPGFSWNIFLDNRKIRSENQDIFLNVLGFAQLQLRRARAVIQDNRSLVEDIDEFLIGKDIFEKQLEDYKEFYNFVSEDRSKDFRLLAFVNSVVHDLYEIGKKTRKLSQINDNEYKARLNMERVFHLRTLKTFAQILRLKYPIKEEREIFRDIRNISDLLSKILIT